MVLETDPDMMKNYRNLFHCAALLLSLAFAVSCAKEGMDFFRGTYGYSTGGSLTLEYQDEETEEALECHASLVPETGIIHIEPKDSTAVLTMRSLVGQTQVFDAEIKGTEIELKPQKRTVSLNLQVDGLEDVQSVVLEVSGRGYKTNGLLVIEMKYEGSFTSDLIMGGRTFTVKECLVNTVANLQD